MGTARTALSCALTVGLVAAMPPRARGGGQEFPDLGAQALARGGAFTAKADDATALRYNVGGLGFLRGTHLLLSTNLIWAASEFQRAGVYPQNGATYDGQPFPRVSSAGDMLVNPMLVFASDLGTRRFTFAAGVFAPSGYGSFQFPEHVTTENGAIAPAPQRYDLVSEHLTVVIPSLAVAWRPTDALAIGAAFHSVYSSYQSDQTLYLAGAQCGFENPACDYRTHLEASQVAAPTGSVGALARLGPAWRIGLNVRLPASIEATGTVKIETGSNKVVPVTYDPGRDRADATVRTHQPWVVRAGASHVWLRGDRERADVELDFVWENWGGVGDTEVTLSRLSPQPSRPIRSPHQWQDTYSVRAGGAYTWDLATGSLTARAGAFYESAAAPETMTRLDFKAWEHVGVGAGAGFRFGGLAIDGGGAYVGLPTRDVMNSRLKQGAALGSNAGSEYTVVGNGSFPAHFVVVTVGVAYSFR